ncbi:hypothetical protein FA13DRAFT_1724575 [Coprinellus micaceus]|uniref:PPPDE domain-containing protein n=1 Tax=Coprinellus micaceus TaxID=71717 RepID=A0A4Y7TXF6_COPMI|nr:hypothetical protein FA13DRAFT_1724575 [Coprinellus micaceus]
MNTYGHTVVYHSPPSMLSEYDYGHSKSGHPGIRDSVESVSRPPPHSDYASQGRYGTGSSVVRRERHATSGRHSSGPTGGVQPRERLFPILLLKRKVKSMRLQVFAEFLGDDGTHWALEVNGRQYHIRPAKDGSIKMSKERVIPEVEPVVIGHTAYTNEDIHEIFDEVLEYAAQFKYNVVDNNCRTTVLSLWFNIRYTWPSLDRLEALLEDSKILFSNLVLLEHRLGRRCFEDSKRFYRNIQCWKGGKYVQDMDGLADVLHLCQALRLTFR